MRLTRGSFCATHNTDTMVKLAFYWFNDNPHRNEPEELSITGDSL